MADLFDRLFPADPYPDDFKIAVHKFFAALVDYAAGETARQEIINYWSLDTEAQTDLDALCDHIDSLSRQTEKLIFGTELHAVMMYAEGDVKYTTKAAFRARLGL